MRRALVLGAAGFLGSHLCRRLVHDGWSVVGTVRDPAAPHVAGRLSDILGELSLRACDVTVAGALDDLVVGADAVFAFAGHSGAAHSLQAPTVDAASNALGQLHLLEALRHHNPDARVVFPGSRLQYGRAQWLPVTEDHPLEPTSVYGINKMVGERYHLLYHQQFGIRTTSLRISIPYGPHQERPDHAFGVVGTFLSRAAHGEPITLYGGGTQLRDYVYVDDLVELCCRVVADDATVGLALNAGGARPISLREMAETLVTVVGSGSVVEAPWPADVAAVETGDYHGDLGRVRRLVGWEPATSLEDGLRATWDALRSLVERPISA
ncbi:MAG TPA: NAD-dependent epimerase/dehydratase family protein [Acidimicrobiales bacterium]|nr:NAD-dependent epimerase/dehydratase family protein [Acidimicrobiales bacterium]